MQAAVESSHRDSMSVSNNKSAANKPHLSKGMMNIGGIKMRTGIDPYADERTFCKYLIAILYNNIILIIY